jgi:predicted MFS family arabinose efflux permease
VLDLTGSATDVGIAFAARTLAQVSTLLVGGVVADRLPRRLVMIGSDFASLAGQLALGTLLVTGSGTLWQIVALQAFAGAATAFYSPASTGLVPQTVPAALLQQANGFMSIARYSAFVFGAAAGGALVATVGPGWAILVDSATFGASIALLAQMRIPGVARSAQAPHFLRDLGDGWRAFTEHTWVWLLTAFISIFFLVSYAPFFVLGPFIAKRSMDGAAGWATVLTGEAIGSLLGAITATRWQPRRPLLAISFIFTVTSVQLALLAAGAPLLAIAPAAAAAGFAFAFGSVIFETSVQRHIEPRKLSRVSAYNWMGAMIFLPAGYALAGPVASSIGMSTDLWIAAAWVVVSSLALLLAHDVRAFGAAPAPEPQPVATPGL